MLPKHLWRLKMKHSKFTSLALFDTIKGFLPEVDISADVLDTAFESGNTVMMARVVSDSFCDQDSADAMCINTFAERDPEMGVYVTPRSRSRFGGSLDDVLVLFKERYKLYPVEEYEHGDVAIKLASNDQISSARAIWTGEFRQGLQLSCRFDSSYAFIAVPKSWSRPSKAFFEEFSNWMNGYSYSLEVLKATLVETNEDGESVFDVEVVDSCGGFYSTEAAESAALESLQCSFEQLEKEQLEKVAI
jgi:hypothetical protein